MLLRSPHVASGDPLPFEFKGSLFTLTVLHLFNLDRKAIERHLAEKIKQAPSFFNNTPVVIDLDGLADPKEGGGGDLKGLYDLLRGHGMIPVGIRNGGPKLQAAARLTGIPVLPENRAAAKKPEPPEPGGPRTRIVNHPVRSGQEIYAPDGDLVVLGAVSAGADVVADGNIHVYGALRGRALAGVKGDVEAWIFCQSLEAQLVSIAGRYRLSDQLDASGLNRAVQIHLKEERLIIERLAR